MARADTHSMAGATASAMTAPLSGKALLAYGSLGFPLSFAALPVYVVLPDWYAQQFGLPLAWLGAVLLCSRLMDAIADPWLGIWIDRLNQAGRLSWAIVVAVPLLVVGFVALFHPPAGLSHTRLTGWLALALLVTYAGFSLGSISHQAWGATLAHSPGGRAGIAAAREGSGLLGVIIAAALPGVAGMTTASMLLAASALAASWMLLRVAPRPAPKRVEDAGTLTLRALMMPLQHAGFRALLGVFALNGIAAAIPATLLLFFVRDVLQLEAFSGLILTVYFVSAVASMPLWSRGAYRFGLVPIWLAGMGLSIAAFIWVVGMERLDPDMALAAFLLLSALSGAALGADLIAPSALAAGLIQGAPGRLREGACFGLWNLTAKLNLALAAGLMLPLLTLLGYVPGTPDKPPVGTTALMLAYGLVPCLLKAGAIATLWRVRPLLPGA